MKRNSSLAASLATRSETQPRRKRSSWRRVLGISAIVLAVLAVVLGLAIWRSLKHVPKFYAQQLEVAPAAQLEAADAFEHEVLELRNRVRHPGTWQSVITEAQINGWLATTLPEKFPDALPKGLSNPRVALSPGRVQAAVRYAEGNVETVFSLDASVFLTEEPNEVAVQIHGAQAGLLPLPLKQLLDEGSRAAAKGNVPLRWQQRNGEPVAVIRVPDEDREFQGRRLRLEQVEVRDGELILSGRMDPLR